MTESVKAFCAACLVMLVVAGCAHKVDGSAACLDSKTETLYVTVTNHGVSPIEVPVGTPNIGCCNAVGLAILMTDSNGKELKRCGRSDEFSKPSFVSLLPSSSKRYAFSEMTIRSVYCNVDLKNYFIKVSFSDQGKSQQVLPIATPVRTCEKQTGSKRSQS